MKHRSTQVQKRTENQSGAERAHSKHAARGLFGVLTLCAALVLCANFNLLHSSINWSAPVTISTPTLTASDPQIIIDSNGNATAAWVENNLIKASTRPVNGSWSAPATVSDGLSATSLPKLGIDSSGNVTVLYLDGGVVYSATLVLGGIWTGALPVSSILGGASEPALSVDASGNAVALWVSGGVINSANRSLGIWGLSSTLSAANSGSPQVAISANGTVIAVWHSVVSGADVIMSATKTLGGNWNAAKSVFSGTAALYHNYPKVAIDPNGNAVIVWFRYNFASGSYQNVSVLTSSLTFNASAWALPSILSHPGLRNPADLMLKIVCDPSGNMIAFWTNSYDGQLFYVESASKFIGYPWNNFVYPYSSSLYSLASDIAVNSLGDVLATYMTWDGSSLNIQSQESDIANPLIFAWTFPNLISQGSENGYPRCPTSVSGNTNNTVTVWINYNGTNDVIKASVGSETVLLPPTNVSVVQTELNFGVFSDYFNTISWQASPAANILQYNIFRNGIFFASTDSHTLQINDHNTVQNGSVTYGVAAMDINYSQSAIAAKSFP